MPDLDRVTQCVSNFETYASEFLRVAFPGLGLDTEHVCGLAAHTDITNNLVLRGTSDEIREVRDHRLVIY